MDSFYPLTHGKPLPEIYHLGFNGSEFEIFMNPTYWDKFVKLASETQFPKNMGSTYVPPSRFRPTFGFHECAKISYTLEGFTCISVPAFIAPHDEENLANTMPAFGRTLSSIFMLLNFLIHDAREAKEIADLEKNPPQLFTLETFISNEARFHGAGFTFSISFLALKYLEHLGKRVLPLAVDLMEDHWVALSSHEGQSNVHIYRGGVDCRLLEYGILHMHTIGSCSCLGVMPQDFGLDGCGLSTHNVDTISQQFNLLVGIAYVWQMVRDGLRTGIPPAFD